MLYFADKQDLVQDIFSRYPETERGRRSALMPLLREVQNAFGYVPEENIEEIAALLGTTATEVKSVMSFYSTYHTIPTGKYHLQVCATLSCAIAGSDELWDHLVDELHIQQGEVTPDGLFSIQKVECLGSCGTAPMMQINDEGYHECVSKKRIRLLLEKFRRGEKFDPDILPPIPIKEGQQELANGLPAGGVATTIPSLVEGEA